MREEEDRVEKEEKAESEKRKKQRQEKRDFMSTRTNRINSWRDWNKSVCPADCAVLLCVVFWSAWGARAGHQWTCGLVSSRSDAMPLQRSRRCHGCMVVLFGLVSCNAQSP